uniref:Uncharacterized protein n=1 Tax=Arcella intermedia TaxID=1963864 RepID=A0A6B2LIA1_9EUKA
MAGVGTSIAGAGLGFLAPGLSIVGMIGGFIGVIALAFMDPTNVTRRQNVFLGITALLGLGIAPLLMGSSLGAVIAATVGTAGIFGGFTLAALKSKRKSMLQLGGVLMGGLFVLVGVSLAGLLLPLLGVTNPAVLAALHSFNLYAGLGIFSLFVAYDTQRMIEDYHDGNRDHVGPALSMFLNIFNIFIRLLAIFRGD